MSYSLRVLKDNPVGFWRLNSASPTTDSSSGYWSAGSRTLNTITLTSTVTASAITSDSTNSQKLSSGSSIAIPNNYNILYKGTEDKSFTIDFWLNFDSIPTSATVFQTVSGSVSLTFADNIAILKFLDDASTANSYYVYSEVESYNSQIHVAIVYSNHSFNLYLNGVASQASQIPTQRFFKDTAASNFSFAGPSSGYYLVDNIAIYNYALSDEQIKNRLIWGLSDGNPHFYTLINNGGFIDPDENSGVADSYFLFNDEQTWRKGKIINCIIEDNNLTSKYIPDAEMYNPNQTPGSPAYSTQSTTTGFTVASGADSLAFRNFESYINIPTQSITANLYAAAATTGSYFSITGFSFGQLVVEKTGAATVKVYNPEGNFTTINLTMTGSAWNGLVISFAGNKITANIGASTGNATTTSVITLSNSTLFVGNSYIDTSGTGTLTTSPNAGNLTASISVFDDADAAALSNFSTYGRFTLSLNSTVSVSQRGEWEILLPAMTSNTVVGNMALLGTSSANVKLYGKTAAGSYTLQTINGEKLPNTPIGSAPVPMYAKVIIDTPVSSRFRPKLSYLEIVNYSDLTIHSVGKAFTITPYTTTYTHSYQFRQERFNILSRSRNFGIHCESQSGTGTDGIAVLTPSSAYKTVEFWFRVDVTPGTGTFYIMHNGTALLTYTNAAMTLGYGTLGTNWTAVYINGSSTLPSTLVAGEIYHFMGTITAGSSANIYLNSSSTPANTGKCTFGEVTLYGDEKSATFAANKYKKYLGTVAPSAVTDSQSISVAELVSVYAANYTNLKVSVE